MQPLARTRARRAACARCARSRGRQRPRVVLGAARRRPVARHPRLRAHRHAQRLALLPGRRPALATRPRAWLLGDGRCCPTYVGYAWSSLLAPITLARGSDFLGALPVVVVLQRAACSPIALLCVYAHRAPDRRPALRLLGRRALDRHPRSLAIPIFDQRLPRQVRRAVPAAVARTDGPGRLPVHGLPARRRLAARPRPRRHALTDVAARRVGGRLRGRDQAVERALPGAAQRSLLLAARRGCTVCRSWLGSFPALLLRALEAAWARVQCRLFTLEEIPARGRGFRRRNRRSHSYIDIDWDSLHRNMSGLRE